MKRIILAGVVGGVAMYIWMFLAHMLLPLGTVGVKEIPQGEEAVLSTLKTSIGTNAGLYLFPGMGLGPNPSTQQQREAMATYGEKLATRPTGILVYTPPGSKAVEPRQFVTELLSEFIVALIAAWLVAQTRLNSFGGRVAFVGMAGLMATMLTNVSYWNWYHFPGNYTASYMFTQFVGYLVAGSGIAWVFRKQKAMGLTAKA